ncbi:MAG: hypothetical protein ABI606_10700 [Rhodoferax sp.]
MSSVKSREAEHFRCALSIFGAVDTESGRIVLVVEATSPEQARLHIDAVLPLLGAKPDSHEVIELEELPDGFPTFLKAFFEAGRIGFGRSDVAPSTSTLQ